MNNVVPKMEPRGTPQVIRAHEEKRFPIFMEKEVDVSHSKNRVWVGGATYHGGKTDSYV